MSRKLSVEEMEDEYEFYQRRARESIELDEDEEGDDE